LRLPERIRNVQDPEYIIAVKIWNDGGGMNWQALPILCEIYGINDPEPLIRRLLAIRQSQEN